MALRFLGTFGGSIDDGIKCVEYAVQYGRQDIEQQLGWGVATLRRCTMRLPRLRMPDISSWPPLAGNDGVDNDQIPHYPSSYELDSIIAVAATDHNDMLASFSCYGATSVDLSDTQE